jgi:hypothetical protein
MIQSEDRLKLFSNELNEISDEKLRNFAEDLIINADDYFFTIAASTTGKYHPQFDLGVGGLVRHTRCVVFFAICEATSRCFEDHEKDLLIVSALAHDIKKLGDGTGKYTVPDHPKWAAEYILSRQEATKLITKKDAKLISDIVYSHMGKWGAQDGMPMPKTELEKALQAADYIASRKEILNFDFKATEKVDIPVEKVNPADFVVEFGKHKGKTIKAVYEEAERKDDTYLHWMARQTDFNNKETRMMGMLYLNEIGKLPEEFKAEINLSNELVDTKAVETKEPEPIVMKETDPVDDLPF